MRKDSTGSALPLYEIEIKGHVDSQWQNWFDGLAITLNDNGNTILRGSLPDQAALHGMLKKINNLGLVLISVNQQSQNEE